MKKVVYYILAFLVSVNVFSQQNPEEVKDETKVKTIRVNNGEKISEQKVKVVTREVNEVKLDKSDKKKINQNRIKTHSKVEKTVLVDNDSDSEYDTLTKVTYYKSGDDDFIFTPNDKGFDIIFNNKSSEKIGSAWHSNSKGYYIVDGKMHNGIGYFDTKGNLVVEYYNKNSNKIQSKTYKIKK